MTKFFRILFYPILLLFRALTDVQVAHLLKNAKITDIDKVNGVDFEHIVAFIFRKMKFKVTQTPASGDYGADLIVRKWGISIAIQCKLYYGHNVGNKAVNEVYGAKTYYNCDYALVLTNSFYTRAAITLANSLNILLYDRKTLQRLLVRPYKKNIKIIKNSILCARQGGNV